jgi:hypothetical protein
MMMAWKVSGLSNRPPIMASRPPSMRLAIAISPSRERISTDPISLASRHEALRVKLRLSLFQLDFAFSTMGAAFPI